MNLPNPTSASALPRGRLFTSPLAVSVLVLAALVGTYGWFLWNPVVFDDIYFFDGSVHDSYLDHFLPFAPRCLPYATLEWTKVLLGLDLIWFRAGNLAIHFANAVLLFLFLRKLFDAALTPRDSAASPSDALSHRGLALVGALLFALHPAAVYGVAYLIQRSSLMAVFFALVMANLFLRGLIQRRQSLLLASALAYLFAVSSKEHVIMAPAVMAALVLLLDRLRRDNLKLLWPTALAYAAIGLHVFLQVRSGAVVGRAYEPEGADLLGQMGTLYPGFDVSLAYPLSVLTQATLFFKYLLLWLVPYPGWMSIDMREPFALTFHDWRYIAGGVAFVVVGVFAVRMIFRGGWRGLLGFAILSPWLMFATEFSTIRIQEPFVLYRSYVWMPMLFAGLPALAVATRRIAPSATAMLMTFIVLLYVPATFDRLQSFSNALLLWDDAARLIAPNDDRPGNDRIFHNRGVLYARYKFYDMAVKDYDRAIRINSTYPYFYNDRAASLYEGGHYAEALKDYDHAIAMSRKYARPFYGRGLTLIALGKKEAAMQDFVQACQLGAPAACKRLTNAEGEGARMRALGAR